ncbi:MAG: NUDIX domain-containing protein, partial [Gammaproteobacteria bacterium]
MDRAGRVLIAGRRGRGGWQFPQGGVQPDESAESAMYRE